MFDISISPDQIWIVVVGFIIAFILSFGIGANDVANSFGTSVGSKVLTLRKACILASIFEVLGSILLGAKVSDTVRKGVLLPETFESANVTNVVKVMMLGQLSSLSGACIWLLLATFLKLPVSGSHSIVGAMTGFALVIQGVHGIDWVKLGFIVLSWFTSPILSGIVSVLCFFIFDKFILKKDDPLEPGLSFLPFIYAITIFINIFSIFLSGPKLLKFNMVPLYGNFIISIGMAIITIVVVKFAMVPYLRKTILTKKRNSLKDINVVLNNSLRVNRREATRIKNRRNLMTKTVNNRKNELLYKMKTKGRVRNPKNTCQNKKLVKLKKRTITLIVESKNPTNMENEVDNRKLIIQDKPEQVGLFSWLQILTAVFGSFAHGGNDVSNAIGPLVGLWILAVTQNIYSNMEVPIWILFFGGLGIIVGLWVWGRRVMKTIGDELTTITPSSGICIELGAAITVLMASNIGIPISTTHCKIGSIVSVGKYRSNDNVDWKIFRNIVIAWLVTVPVTAGIGALVMFLLKMLI